MATLAILDCISQAEQATRLLPSELCSTIVPGAFALHIFIPLAPGRFVEPHRHHHTQSVAEWREP